MNECTMDVCSESGAMCSSTPIAGCRRVAVQSGNYTLTPRVTHQCQDELFKEPVLSLDLATVRIDANASGTTVTGGPVPLTGPAVTGGMLRVSGTVSGLCLATITLTATFSEETRFSGHVALAFLGSWCSVTNCEARTIPVSGVRSP
jgi:hypothetical protein